MQALTAHPASAGTPKHRKPAALAALAALALLPALAWAQTAPLNDTGQTLCYSAANAPGACDEATTGNTGTGPGQDGRFGRDAARAAGALPAKIGGGEAGFDFTALDASGATTTPGTNACVKDNVTGLLWSTEVLSMHWEAATTSHPGNGSGSYNRCGHNTGWRLPTRRELLSIVHRGRSYPSIDAAYFPGHPWVNAYFWAVDQYAPYPIFAWGVNFDDGNTGAYLKDGTYAVRLVRSGQ